MSRGPSTNGNGSAANFYVNELSTSTHSYLSNSEWHLDNDADDFDIGNASLNPPQPGVASHSHLFPPSRDDIVEGSTSPSPLKIKLRIGGQSIGPVGNADEMVATRRRSSAYGSRQEQRQEMRFVSGSEFDEEDAVGEDDDVHDEPPRRTVTTSRGRQIKRPNYADDDEFDEFDDSLDKPLTNRRQSGRSRRDSFVDYSEDGEHSDEPQARRAAKTAVRAFPARNRPARSTRSTRSIKIDPDEDEPYEDLPEADTEGDMELDEDVVHEADVIEKRRSPQFRSETSESESPPPVRTRRLTRRTAALNEDDDWAGEEEEEEAAPRQLRARKEVNYTIPPPLEDVPKGKDKGKGREQPLWAGLARGVGSAAGRPLIPWGAGGKALGRALGEGDSSDSDIPRTPHKNRGAFGGAAASMGMPGFAGGSNKGNVLGGAGGSGGEPNNFGRVNPKSALADIDPLGIDPNVTFDNVGGLDDHINQLKEMVALPLLYPELFLRFGVTPPRGVLFHGPPGTGKTLLARALAASCSTGDTKISFFMRKGADCLSKWVGEAERQLRMLFEEARNSQPSIIFFDEIDGLAPVRSSKQEQIHASIVSTLLALMDGMDGRGQVIIIGATNRPDAVDPALRRPGRFDREFYFPLPNRAARKKILSINTKVWDPPLEDAFLDQLSVVTKGYGGADLRALCTEASLNAIQRRYPQIYKSNDRLLLDPKTIQVQAKDFMIAAKKMVPSSARATASAAVPLPTQLVPLLSTPLDNLKSAVDRALPPAKKRSVLEEAEYEDDDDGSSFAKEVMLQSLENLRVYRPRVMLHGPSGLGQAYLGPAILHHLEGYHVQSFDLATLMSDSTRTIEAAIVQLFIEAKRHKPSILFFPALTQWSYAVSEVARSTVTAMLEGIAPSDPVLLLAIVDGNFIDLPADVQTWFGHTLHNRLELSAPSADRRVIFFSDLLANVTRSPADFPDAVPRKRRVLEVLPKAPPLPPRKLTEAELAAQEEQDSRLRDVLKLSLVPILQDLQKTFKKAAKTVLDDSYDMYAHLQASREQAIAEAQAAGAEAGIAENGAFVVANADGANGEPVAEANAAADAHKQTPEEINARFPEPRRPHKVDLDIINRRLYKDRYLTPQDLLDDLECIVENAESLGDHDRLARLRQMTLKAKLAADSFEQQWKTDWERAAVRERARRATAAEAAAAAAAQEMSSVAEPLRHSARADGKDPEVGMTDPAALERSLKRQRSQDGPNGEEPGSKRQKDDDVVMAEGSVTIVAMDSNVASAIPNIVLPSAPPALLSHNGETEALSASQEASRPSYPAVSAPAAITPPPVATSLPVGLGPDSHSAAAAVPSPPSEPPAAFPLFSVPGEELNALRQSYRDDTAGLNIEQLEQLRAMSLDVIWRGRTEWNRGAMVADLSAQLQKFVEEVRPVEMDDGSPGQE